jgi:Flp pilus assembly protein TadG
MSASVALGMVMGRMHDAGPRPMLRVRKSFRVSLCRSWSRATAALEFALATPLLVVMLGGAADYGLAQFYRTNLANAVAAGCQYAYVTGAPASPTGNPAFVANIKSMVTTSMFLPPGATSNLSIAVTGPAGYCVTGTGPTMSSATAGSVCQADGSVAGTYVLITATYTNTGLMNGFMSATTQAITESATVRLN